MTQKLNAEHGIVCRILNDKFGYFGWPSVTRLTDGTLIVISSGLRSEHVCPWGKTVLNVSTDNGATWSSPRVINDSPLDDRDAGIVDLGDGKLLATWFTSDTRIYFKEEWVKNWLGDDEIKSWAEKLNDVTDDIANQHIGSWVMLSNDAGATWGKPIRVPVSTPHGPIKLRNGNLLYLGKPYGTWDDMNDAIISAANSVDGGYTWNIPGSIPVFPGTDPANYHEPHVVELADGKLIGMIRVENHSGKDLADAGVPTFSMMLTESTDGGKTWTTAKPLGFHGSPPHLLRHSTGVLILTYGYRQEPFGQRMALSYDEGATWIHDYIIRDDGPDGDLGYPSTVEMADGSLFTLCYQKVPGDKKCSLLWSKWELP
jgi:hypothetical protein